MACSIVSRVTIEGGPRHRLDARRMVLWRGEGARRGRRTRLKHRYRATLLRDCLDQRCHIVSLPPRKRKGTTFRKVESEREDARGLSNGDPRNETGYCNLSVPARGSGVLTGKGAVVLFFFFPTPHETASARVKTYLEDNKKKRSRILYVVVQRLRQGQKKKKGGDVVKKKKRDKDVRNSKPGEEETKVWKVNSRGLYAATAMYKNRNPRNVSRRKKREGGWRRKIGGAM